MTAPSTNRMRAEAAHTALEAYSLAKGTCPNGAELTQLELLTDLLADLLHWSDAEGLAFDTALRLARMHHEEERVEESC